MRRARDRHSGSQGARRRRVASIREMPSNSPQLAVRLLGNFAVEVDGSQYAMPTPRRTLAILAYLLLNRGAAVSREFLAYFMWPDDTEESARTKLRSNLHDLNRALPPPAPGHWIVPEGDNLRWNPEAELRLDVDDFTAYCADPERREEGVDLYRGELLAALYDEWIFPPRERYRNLYLSTLTELISDARRRRDFPRAAARAHQLLAVDPWREDVVRRLVAIRYESGDRAGALVEYHNFATRLQAELGVEPMPETQAVRDAIVRDDALDAETPPSTPPAHFATLSPSMPFVGRESELDLLTQAWSRAARGNGSVVFIGGESGIGKSRLALEFAHKVEEQGGRVLTGTTGMPEATPYQCIVEALRSALPLIASLHVRDVWLAALSTIVPELRAQVRTLPALTKIDGDGERTRLFESLVRTLEGLSRPRPLVLILEDVHWSDEATSSAIEFLHGRMAALSMLLILTYRDDELPRLHPLQRLRRDWVLTGQARSLSLRPLPVHDIALLLDALPNVYEGDAATLHALSEGNPLFLTQLVEGGSVLADGLGGTLRNLVSQRLQSLTPQTRTIAEIAALVGTQFSREVVRQVSGWGEAATEDALDELIERRIVREASGRGFFDYAFAHHLVQSTIADSAQADRAAARHRRIARALEALYPERAGELSPRIARHYDLAGDAGAASTHYLAAANRALSIGALDEAAAHVARGLELCTGGPLHVELLFVSETLAGRRGDYATRTSLLDRLDAATAGIADADGRRAVLLRRAAFAHERKDRAAESAALSALRPLVDPDSDRRWFGLIKGAEALHLLESDKVAEAESSAEASLAALIASGDDVEEAEARYRLAEIVTLRGDVSRAETLFEEARAAGERARDTTTSLRALKGSYQIAFYRTDLQRGLEVAQAILDLGSASGDRFADIEGHSAMANALDRLRQRPEDAYAHIRSAIEISQQIGNHIHVAASLVIGAMHDCATGDLDAARNACERALRIYDEHPVPARLRIVALLTLAVAELMADDGRGAIAHAEKAVELAHASGLALLEAAAASILADAAGVAGEYVRAIEYKNRSVEMWDAKEVKTDDLGPALASLALWSAALGDIQSARGYAHRSLAYGVKIDGSSHWPQAVYWSIAQALRACGEEASADDNLRKSYEQTQAAAARLPEAARPRFLSVAWHPHIIRAAEQGVWPDPPR